MTERRINGGLIVSAIAHAAVLLWAAVSFAAKPHEVPPTDALFVETISMSDFSQMVAGSKTAQKKQAPKPLVEKKAEPKPAENQSAQVAEKPEIVTASASGAAPPQDSTPKVAPRQAQPVPSPPEKSDAANRQPEKKQPDAEALKPEKPEPKKEAKKLPARAPAPPSRPQKKLAEKPPQPEQSRFDADAISALLDKRQPRRLAAAGDVLNPTPALGTARGSAPQLTQNEIDMLRARIQQCWNPPAGQADANELTVLVRIQFNPDGSLATEPRLLTRVSPGYQQVAAESALRAIRRCAPYSFMPAAKYDAWKDIEVNFDPRELFSRG
ncbi:MAG TPA: cell envelope integrity protein TolA [Xanthobacteraceae bacterium]|nr:cell envelope integrity protein TolA [Xanthobacteraceae bacterium]